MFGKTKVEEPVSSQYQELLDELRELAGSVAILTGEKEALGREKTLREEITQLQARSLQARAEANEKEITLDRVKEQHAREKREIEHKVGLHKKQVELDIDVARRKTELEVREQNLSEERRRFEEEMTFTRDQFEKQVGYLQGMMKEVLGRLPEVKVERTYHTEEHVGDTSSKKKPELNA